MRDSNLPLVDRELAPFLSLLPGIDLGTDDLPALRRRLNAARAMAQTGQPECLVRESHVPAAGAPDVRVLIYQPLHSSGLLPALLHIHGGGMVLGQAESQDPESRLFAAEVGCVVVSVDYRLSPETPFPGPLEDCYVALQWLYQNASRLGVDAQRIAVGGQSAGGGLAAGLALLARDRGEIPLVLQLLIYPMLDDRTGGAADPSLHAYDGDYGWNAANNQLAWAAWLGFPPGARAPSGYAAPARAEALAGLPPAFVAVGALDLFLEEDVAYAQRLLRAGIPTELHVYPGAFHAFDQFPGTSLKAVFTADCLRALRRAFKLG